MTLKNYRTPLLYYIKLVHHFKAMSEFNIELQSGNAQFGSKSAIFCPVRPWNLADDLENNRAPLLCYFKFLHHFVAVGEFKLELQSGNVQWFLEPCDLEIWPSKPIGHLFYATSSFVHHFAAIDEFKLELESGNAQSGSNLTIFRAVWPWNLTFKTNRSPVVCNFKLCASFCSHCWIQTGVKVRKRPIWVKFDDF